MRVGAGGLCHLCPDRAPTGATGPRGWAKNGHSERFAQKS